MSQPASMHSLPKVDHSFPKIDHKISSVKHPKGPSREDSSLSPQGKKESKPSCLESFFNFIASILKNCLKCCFPNLFAKESNETAKPKVFSQADLRTAGQGYINALLQESNLTFKKPECKAIFIFKINGQVADAHWGTLKKDDLKPFKARLEETLMAVTKDKQASSFEVESIFIESLGIQGFDIHTSCYDTSIQLHRSLTANSNGATCGFTQKASTIVLEKTLKSRLRGACGSPEREKAYDTALIAFLNPYKPQADKPRDFHA